MATSFGRMICRSPWPAAVAAPSWQDSRLAPPVESAPAPGKRRLPPLSIPEGGTSLEDVEHALVELALQQSHGNQIKAAKLLNISRDALALQNEEVWIVASRRGRTRAAEQRRNKLDSGRSL